MEENILILLIGLPYSGKSTWAREQRLPIVNPDSIRLALHGQRFQILAEPFVWAIAFVMVHALFLAGHRKVILDATNISKKRRDFWKSKDWRTVYKIISTDKEICINRAREWKDEEIIPIIEQKAKEYETLTNEELENILG